MVSKKTIVKYLTPEVREAFRPCTGLTDREHWAVFICLLMEGGHSLTKMREIFDSTYYEMRPILEDLVQADLVEQFSIYTDEWMDLDKRLYRPSIRGIRFFEMVFDVCIPRRGR